MRGNYPAILVPRNVKQTLNTQCCRIEQKIRSTFTKTAEDVPGNKFGTSLQRSSPNARGEY